MSNFPGASEPRGVRRRLTRPLSFVGYTCSNPAWIRGHFPILALLGCLLAHPGCNKAQTFSKPEGLQQATGSVHERAVAVVEGRPIFEGELWRGLAELGGSAALEDVVLDGALSRELGSRGITLTAADIARERSLLLGSLAGEGAQGEGESREVLDRLRRARGLGPRRFEASLRRSASLRALVAEEVAVTPGDVELEILRVNAGTVRLRLITLADQSRAAGLRELIASQPSGEPRTLAFAREALMHSTDASASAGGLLAPVGPLDPGVPGVVRRAIEGLAPGELSPVLAVEGGFAVVMVESREAFGGPPPDPARVEGEIRRREERRLMERRARELVVGASVSVLDPSLGWAWESRAGR